MWLELRVCLTRSLLFSPTLGTASPQCNIGTSLPRADEGTEAC